MFKNFQNNLLLRHPLLYNTRVVPMIAITLIINVLFFCVGYADGAIDFTDTSQWSYDDTTFVVTVYAFFIALLVFIVWLVYYFRHNAYKSFYPQSNYSLYKEWCVIALVCVLNCSYSASYLFAKDLRARSYFSEAEFSRRADVLSMASLFIAGDLSDYSYYNKPFKPAYNTTQDSVLYNGKPYALSSLLNKPIKSYSYQNHEKDSLNERRIKNWLVANRKDSVLWVMKEFEKIAAEHGLKGNISTAKWMALVYQYPEFNSPIAVDGIEKVIYEGYDDISTDTTEIAVAPSNIDKEQDTLSYRVQMVNGQKELYSKYYVPGKQLHASYGKISEAWVSPDLNEESALIYLYFGLMTSLAIFSFRVTSGKNWLIALVGTGIMGILTGIIGIVGSSFEVYGILWIFITLASILYFIAICYNGSGKSISGIVLNNVLWLTPWLIPLVYMTTTSIARRNDQYDYMNYESSFAKTLTDYSNIMMYGNLVLVVIYMYFLTVSIKKWKGIAEA